MDASRQSFAAFLKTQDTKFIIPVYQRNYDWKKEHCQQLWEDVKKSGKDNKEHFTGSIVYVADEVADNGATADGATADGATVDEATVDKATADEEYVIIDGQQRLTTVSLIYLAIANAVTSEEGKKRILQRYLINTFTLGNAKLKLKSNATGDFDALQHILDHGDKDFGKQSRIIENYQFFRKCISSDNALDVEKWMKKLFFVAIRLKRSEDDPQKIFESMNSTGLGLNAADLIRNYILMNLETDAQERLHRVYWNVIEKNARLGDNKSQVSEFVRHYLTIKKHSIPSIDKVYRVFKENYANESCEDGQPAKSLEDALEDMREFSGYYRNILNPEQEKDPEISAHLFGVKRLNLDVCHPFLLEVYRDYVHGKINSNIFIDVLKLVQSYLWRRIIMQWSNSGVNKTFLSLYRDVANASRENYLERVQRSLVRRGGSQRFPKDSDVRHMLKTVDVYNIEPSRRNYFLEQLENHENREPIKIEGNDKITVEHIFPQTTDALWQKSVSGEEFLEMKERLHTIANLTLSGNNGALGNSLFKEKRDMNLNTGKQGYKFSNLSLTRALAELDKWGIDEMDKRLDFIWEKRFVEIWAYPDVPAEPTQGHVNIGNIYDFTGRNVSRYIFKGNSYECRNITHMYSDVLRILFDLQKESFIGQPLGDRIKLTKTPEQRKNTRYTLLSDGYYVLTHGSNDILCKKLLYVLIKLGMEGDLQVELRND